MADHDCVEGLPDGIKFVRAQALPREWFLVGGNSILNDKTHTALKGAHGNAYRTGDDEGPFGLICLVKSGVYITISTNSFGTSADFSRTKPKCETCKEGALPTEDLRSGTGLALGMTRGQVQKVLGVTIGSKTTSTLEFQETLNGNSGKTWHVESLRLTFGKGVLVRFIVSDYSEAA